MVTRVLLILVTMGTLASASSYRFKAVVTVKRDSNVEAPSTQKTSVSRSPTQVNISGGVEIDLGKRDYGVALEVELRSMNFEDLSDVVVLTHAISRPTGSRGDYSVHQSWINKYERVPSNMEIKFTTPLSPPFVSGKDEVTTVTMHTDPFTGGAHSTSSTRREAVGITYSGYVIDVYVGDALVWSDASKGSLLKITRPHPNSLPSQEKRIRPKQR